MTTRAQEKPDTIRLKRRYQINKFVAIDAAVCCLQARLTISLELTGRLPLNERSAVIYRLGETAEGSELELIIAHRPDGPPVRAEQLQVWLLTGDGGSLRKIKVVQEAAGAPDADFSTAFHRVV